MLLVVYGASCISWGLIATSNPSWRLNRRDDWKLGYPLVSLWTAAAIAMHRLQS